MVDIDMGRVPTIRFAAPAEASLLALMSTLRIIIPWFVLLTETV
jgi:hypothetical protein